jgi:hypothetical protein
MTESDWLHATDPQPMLDFLAGRGNASKRKLRLFAVACCRLLLRKVRAHHFWAEHAVGVAERFADGAASAAELAEAYGPAPADWRSRIGSETGDFPLDAVGAVKRSNGTAGHACWNAAESEFGPEVADCCALNAAWAVAEHEAVPPDDNTLSPAFRARLACEQSVQCDRLRDIFGPAAFRPLPTLDPGWLAWKEGAVLRLAEAAYEERCTPEGMLDALRLAILADALEDAGCADAELLGHLHGSGPHVRGCWALDVVLGKG